MATRLKHFEEATGVLAEDGDGFLAPRLRRVYERIMQVEATFEMWFYFSAFFAFLLVMDYLCFTRISLTDRIAVLRISIAQVLFFGLVSLGFAIGIYYNYSFEAAESWLLAYCTEVIFSFDNLVLFKVIVEDMYSCPRGLQGKPLFLGVVGAIVLRLGLYVIAEILIEKVIFVSILLALFMIWSGYKAIITPSAHSESSSQELVDHMDVPDFEAPVVSHCTPDAITCCNFLDCYDSQGRFFVNVKKSRIARMQTDVEKRVAEYLSPTKRSPSFSSATLTTELHPKASSMSSRGTGDAVPSSLKPPSKTPSPAAVLASEVRRFSKGTSSPSSSNPKNTRGEADGNGMEATGGTATPQGKHLNLLTPLSFRSNPAHGARDTDNAMSVKLDMVPEIPKTTVANFPPVPSSSPSVWRMTRSVKLCLALMAADAMFALDAVATLIGQVDDLFLAYTACCFGMLGLRPGYFLVTEGMRFAGDARVWQKVLGQVPHTPVCEHAGPSTRIRFDTQGKRSHEVTPSLAAAAQYDKVSLEEDEGNDDPKGGLPGAESNVGDSANEDENPVEKNESKRNADNNCSVNVQQGIGIILILSGLCMGSEVLIEMVFDTPLPVWEKAFLTLATVVLSLLIVILLPIIRSIWGKHQLRKYDWAVMVRLVLLIAFLQAGMRVSEIYMRIVKESHARATHMENEIHNFS